MSFDGFDSTMIGIGTQRGMKRRSAHVPVPDFPAFNLSGVEHAKALMRITLRELLRVGGGILRSQDFEEAVDGSVVGTLGFWRQRGEAEATERLQERLSVLLDDPSVLDASTLARDIRAAYMRGVEGGAR